MDILKDIFEAVNSRVKSPFLGSIALAFVAFNWKSLYYLVFSGKPALMKFDYFDANTDPYSLYVWPLVVGVGLALATPWIGLLGTVWATWPVHKQRSRQDKATHERLRGQNLLLAERNNEQSLFEQSLIDEAKRDSEIEEIDDEDIKEDLKSRIKIGRVDNRVGPPPMPSSHKDIKILDDEMYMKVMTVLDEGSWIDIFNAQVESKSGVAELNTYSKEDQNYGYLEIDSVLLKLKRLKDFVEAQGILDTLVTFDLMEGTKDGIYRLTASGFDFYDRMKLDQTS